jgi:branched-chain amino acid transport system permease protein
VNTLVQHLVDAISLGSLYTLIALGIALIFGIVGMINFAHGELIMIGGFVLVALGAVAFPILAIATVLVVALAAITMERTAFRPVRGADPATLLVTSFAVSFLLQNLALLIEGPRSKGVDVLPSLQDALSLGDVRIQKLNIAIIVTTAVLVVALDLFLRRTSLGLQLRAAAESFDAARLMGVRANLVIAVAFAISGILAGVAAIFLVAQGGAVYPTIGLPPLIIAFVAVVIGGLYSLRGAVVGSFVLAFVTVALQAWLPDDLQQFVVAFTYSFVLLILLVRPEGIVASRSLRGRVG